MHTVNVNNRAAETVKKLCGGTHRSTEQLPTSAGKELKKHLVVRSVPPGMKRK